MYGLSEQDRQIQARARGLADEVLSRSRKRPNGPAGTCLPRDRRARQARPRARPALSRTCRKNSAAAAAPPCSKCSSRSRWAGSPTRWAGWRPPRRPGCPPWPPAIRSTGTSGPRSRASARSVTRSPRRARGLTSTRSRRPRGRTATSTCSTASSGTSPRTTRPTSPSSRPGWPAGRTTASTRCSWWNCRARGPGGRACSP